MVRTLVTNKSGFDKRNEYLRQEMEAGKSMFDIIKAEDETLDEETEYRFEETEETEERDEYTVTPDKVRLFFKQIAKDNNLSSNMLANLLDISATSMQNWLRSNEKDVFIPTLKILTKVAIGLEVPLHECVRLLQSGERPPLLKIKRKSKIKSGGDFNTNDIQKLADNLLSLSAEERSNALQGILSAFAKAKEKKKFRSRDRDFFY
jgi:transcriptional regulator with XRE-family HTH domain